eukprot:775713-Amphidinium_carterae.2
MSMPNLIDHPWIRSLSGTLFCLLDNHCPSAKPGVEPQTSSVLRRSCDFGLGWGADGISSAGGEDGGKISLGIQGLADCCSWCSGGGVLDNVQSYGFRPHLQRSYAGGNASGQHPVVGAT